MAILRICASCQWSITSRKIGLPPLKCKRFPPAPVVNGGHVYWEFARVDEADSCGEWADRAEYDNEC